MGQAAPKFEPATRTPKTAEVVRLNPDPRPRAGAERSVAAEQSQLPALLEMVSRAATVLSQRKDRAETMEERAVLAEGRLAEMSERLSETERRLQLALDDMERERTRADDLGHRSAELIAKTQSMLADANDRRLAAEWRAEQAEESFATLRSAVEKGFATAL